ncbi:hypothetical protein [Phocaeicola vulgatus]
MITTSMILSVAVIVGAKLRRNASKPFISSAGGSIWNRQMRHLPDVAGE